MTNPITPISGAAGIGTDAPTTSMDGPNSTLDRDAFLKLLVAQLKYQDPTKPADASQMVAQSAQLTMVDRLNEISAQMTTSASSQRFALASAVVGKEITFAAPDGTTRSALATSARLDGDEVVLTAGEFTVPMGSVLSIGVAPTPAPAPAATT
jgi:flagellar basal-body rod modification protein FlgD